MMRHHLVIVTIALLIAGSAWAGDSVLDMPPPPKKVPAVAAATEPGEAQVEVTVGQVALHRYGRSRVGATYTSLPPVYRGYYGPTIYRQSYYPYNYYPYGYGYWGCGSGVYFGTLLNGRPFFWGGNTRVTFR